ncbi:MAG: hypothetical protein JG777_2878, partial [Clostridia bacterium]|nr:hypothetical protein [Clostridia bacterium]
PLVDKGAQGLFAADPADNAVQSVITSLAC